MNIKNTFVRFDKSYHPKWLAVFRILLGLSLFVKGILFIQNKSLITNVIEHTSLLRGNEWLEVLIPWMHLLGGVFIIIGLFTRIAIMIQIPILIGAIVFVNAKKGVYAGDSELLLAIILLIILLFFLFEGGGPLSWDKYLNKQKAMLSKRKTKRIAST